MVGRHYTLHRNGFVLLNAELWEKDMSSEMKIPLSTTGFQSVDLRCDADHFTVNVTLDSVFEGVVYIRGTYNDKKPPCFKRHDQTLLREKDRITIGMRIPFNKCRTVMDVAESCYSNTLVVQHDPELIMPGDAAFNLDCSFEPEFKVTSNVSAEAVFKSKISLVNADPSVKTNLKDGKFTVSSQTDKVSFVPKGQVKKDEL
ncbi:hypothetical protein RUM44_007875 [Polyplax serrata]|uniref:ZP domain-containing protein n=1 Tax=Polyplax serrata TaxID=468196 RepID=A0ABR1B7C5_POLSC